MGVEARQARSHRPGGGQRPRGSQSQGVGGAAPAAEAPTHRAGVLPRSEPALHHRLNSPPTYIRLGMYGLRRLRRLSREVTRKQPGSANRRKAALALGRRHPRVRNQRIDALHKATTSLARAKSVIVLEDLHVAGLVRNRHLARTIADQGWAEFQRQLEDKCQWYGSRLLVAPRFFPSSRTCSRCGLVKATLPLQVRVFCCDGCGLIIDRDWNAARNLAQLVDNGLVAASSAETQNACGEGSAGLAESGLVELP